MDNVLEFKDQKKNYKVITNELADMTERLSKELNMKPTAVMCHIVGITLNVLRDITPPINFRKYITQVFEAYTGVKK